MKLENNLIQLNDNKIYEEQEKFLETTLGKTINSAFDIGLRIALPDFIENNIIDLKNNLLNYGLKEGINKSIESSIDVVKNTVGIITGDFNSISEVKMAVKNGGLIDNLSDIIDLVIDKINNKGLINLSTCELIKNGKDVILDNIENNIENTFDNQIESIGKVENYIKKWNEYFLNKDFNKMELQYKNLQNELKNLLPIEKIINEAKIVDNLHTLIKNNGNNFNLTNEEIELAKKLI